MFAIHSNRAARTAVLGLGLALISGLAQAHTGHGTDGLGSGLIHPLGADHLLAMVAVGLWSVFALPANKAWQGPATFMIALILSAAAGVAGLRVPFLEHAIALSVVLFGVMLVLAARSGENSVPKAVGLGLIAVAASLHGLAHGAETPESGFAAYAVGFLITTAALHYSGVIVGVSLRRWFAQRSATLLATAGLGMGATGLYLFSQI